jgi:hypothetical protein
MIKVEEENTYGRRSREIMKEEEDRELVKRRRGAGRIELRVGAETKEQKKKKKETGRKRK